MAEPRAPLLANAVAWGANLRFRTQVVLALLAGVLSGFGQAPFDIWTLALIGFALHFGFVRHAASARRAALLGWAAGAGYFALTLHWIVEPFMVDAARHGWMAPFALILMAGGLALFWGLAGYFTHRLGRSALAWITALTLAEVARATLFTGFPWAMIGYIWAESAVTQWAALFGPYGLTLIALAAATALWHFNTAEKPLAFGLALFGALALGGGMWLQSQDATLPQSNASIIRLIQPNAPQHQKWDPEWMPVFYQRQLDFTATVAETKPDLIIWPETALPYLLAHAGPALQEIADTAGGTPVVLGLRRFQEKRLHNSLVVIDADGIPTGLYDKHHLVPFGEYMPLGNLLARFGIHGLAASEGAGFSAGPGARLVSLGTVGRALPLICYEAVFARDVNAAPARPEFLLQITNDAWFGGFSGPYQHLAQARMRAIEQGLPMVRVANTGVSAVIGPRGEITAALPLGEAGYLDAALPAPLPPTLYARLNDWPAYALILLLLAVASAQSRRAPRLNGD